EAAAKITGDRIAPVVILTAFSQRELVERAREAGTMAYLVKPFAKRDLVPAIELAVSRFSELQALEAEVAGLNERLETRKLIDRAKGLLMTHQGLTEPDAFRWIQRTAMDRRTTMKAIAQAVIDNIGKYRQAAVAGWGSAPRPAFAGQRRLSTLNAAFLAAFATALSG